jgi:hypothetical protein
MKEPRALPDTIAKGAELNAMSHVSSMRRSILSNY